MRQTKAIFGLMKDILGLLKDLSNLMKIDILGPMAEVLEYFLNLEPQIEEAGMACLARHRQNSE